MAMPEGNIVKSSFRRGMMFDVNDHSAPEDSVKFINNMLLSPEDAVSTRDGRQRRQDTAIGDIVYDVFRWLGSDSSYRDIVAHKSGSDMVYGHADGTGALNNAIGSLTLGNPVIGMQKKFRLFLNNGNDDTRVYVFDSSVQTRTAGLGSGPTLGSITPTDAGAGSIEAGTYKYRISAVYGDDGESAPGIESQATVTIGASRNINVHGASSWSHPTEPAGMTRTAYNVYRNQSGDTEFHFVAQLSASATTYTDSTTQATVDGNDIMPGNLNGPPSKLTGMVWWDHENVAIAWGEKATVDGTVYPNRLFFSETGKPELWKTEQDDQNASNTAEFQDVPQESNDNPIISVVVDGAFCYVFNRKGVRLLRPTGVARAYKVDIVANSEDHGIIGPKAVTVTDSGEIYYVSTDGLRVIRGLVDVEVSPNTDSATRGLVTKGAIGNVGSSVSSIIRNIPANLRQYVYAHEFRDMVHISLATSKVSGSTPSLNNDVLIYDIPTQGFAYSRDRNVYGWATINDSGNEYALLGCGYSVPMSAPTTTKGNVWKEYVSGATVDQDADGNSTSIDWSVTDFSRAVPGFDAGKLKEMLVDVAASNGVVTAKLDIDNGRLSSTKQFSFDTATKTAWQDASYWQSDPANDLSGDAGFNDGSAEASLAALFTAISDGEFRIVVNATNYDITGLNFSLSTTMSAIVFLINSALDTASCPAHLDFVNSPGYFRFTHDSVGAANSVTDVTSVPAGVGTNIATAALLGTGASEIVSQAVDVPASKTGLEWWSESVADPTALKHDWSGGDLLRGKPNRALFHGERAQMVATTIQCTTPMVVYGYRIRYHVLRPSGAGVA